MNIDIIRPDNCDSCGITSSSVILVNDAGQEVLAFCKVCNPSAYEAASRRDIDLYLNGGIPFNSYISAPIDLPSTF
jgi:hypothetical protein